MYKLLTNYVRNFYTRKSEAGFSCYNVSCESGVDVYALYKAKKLCSKSYIRIRPMTLLQRWTQKIIISLLTHFLQYKIIHLVLQLNICTERNDDK